MPLLGNLYKKYPNQILGDDNFKIVQPNNTKWLYDWFKDRINHNMNVLALYVGGTGSGKSYSALSTALMWDPDFPVENIVFNVKDFMATMANMHKGDVIVFDDAGLGVSAKDWRDQQVRIFGKVVQSFRYKNLITLMTTPDLTFIETTSRKLLNILFQASELQQGLFYPKIPYTPKNYTLRNINTFFAYPRYVYNGVKYKATKIHFPLIPEKIADAYESRKAEFIEQYYATYREAVNKTGAGGAENVKERHKRRMSPNSLANLRQNRNKKESE